MDIETSLLYDVRKSIRASVTSVVWKYCFDYRPGVSKRNRSIYISQYLTTPNGSSKGRNATNTILRWLMEMILKIEGVGGDCSWFGDDCGIWWAGYDEVTRFVRVRCRRSICRRQYPGTYPNGGGVRRSGRVTAAPPSGPVAAFSAQCSAERAADALAQRRGARRRYEVRVVLVRRHVCMCLLHVMPVH